MYQISNFLLNRGSFNSPAMNSTFVSVQHSYKSTTDTLSQISAASYFPADFGFQSGLIQDADTILVMGVDAFAVSKITSASSGVISIPAETLLSGIKCNLYDGLAIGDTMLFGPSQTVPILMGSATAPITPVGGLLFAGGVGGQLTSYQNQSVSVTVQGPWAATKTLSFQIKKFDSSVYIIFKAIPAAVVSLLSPLSPTIVSSGAIPVFARPASNKQSMFFTINNSGLSIGVIIINTAGDITIYPALAGLGFANLGNAGTWDNFASYDAVN